MTAIQGYTQMLLQSPELSEEDLDAAVIINERLNVLNQLLNQLFEFARIEADEMDFSYTTFDLNAVLRSVAVSFFKSFAKCTGIILGKKNILTRASKNPIIQIIHVNFLVLINFITILLSAKFKLIFHLF